MDGLTGKASWITPVQEIPEAKKVNRDYCKTYYQKNRTELVEKKRKRRKLKREQKEKNGFL